MTNNRESFGGRFAVLVALVGSAVGLGNLWRFPYLVGRNGGAAFILIYIVIALLICLPMMLSEGIIGRRAGANVFRSFKKLAPGSGWWLIGIGTIITTSLIISFYSVVGGWIIYFLVKSATLQLSGDATANGGIFTSLISSPIEPLVYTAIFLFATGGIISMGVKSGIEKVSKILMPLLFVCTVIIAVESLMLPGSSKGVEFLFKPDFSKVTAETVFQALGQAFFSMSLGCGIIITYSSYIKKNEHIVTTSFITSCMDTLFALIAGLAIMPAVFAFGQEPAQGPGLLFVILPDIFTKIPGGEVIAILFFVVVFVAAVTSSISLLEIDVAFLSEEFGWSRAKSATISSSIIFIFSVLCSLSMGPLKDFTIAGKTIFDLFDYVTANILMTVCSLGCVLFAGWKLKREDIIDELTNAGKLKISPATVSFFIFSIRYIAPAAIIIIAIFSLFA